MQNLINAVKNNLGVGDGKLLFGAEGMESVKFIFFRVHPKNRPSLIPCDTK